MCKNRKRRGMGGSIFKGAASGALTGASFGPIGAGVGALVGGLTGFFGGKKEEEQKKEMQRQLALEQEIEQANRYINDQMSLQSYNNMYNERAMGGMIPVDTENSIASFLEAALQNGDYQVLNNDMAKLNGKSHENGGILMDANMDNIIETELEGNEVLQQDRVFSKRIKPNSDTMDMIRNDGFSVPVGSYAKVAESLGRQKKKYEDKLEKEEDEPSINTGRIMLSRIENLLDVLFYDQELKN